jgi:hypothetical protein
MDTDADAGIGWSRPGHGEPAQQSGPDCKFRKWFHARFPFF